jgi:biopolymer transport protein ExbB
VTSLDARLLEALLAAGPAWVLFLLLGLSVLSVAVALERAWLFVHEREDVAALEARIAERLAAGDVAGAQAAVTHRSSAAARVAATALSFFARGGAAVEEIAAGAKAKERLRMERGLAFLGTLGNNAPFIGLFGTVLGIIRAFRDLAQSTIEGSAAVMAGIAEALVATAVGLLVALPAVAVFNLFQRTIRARLARSDAIVNIVVAYAKAK